MQFDCVYTGKHKEKEIKLSFSKKHIVKGTHQETNPKKADCSTRLLEGTKKDAVGGVVLVHKQNNQYSDKYMFTLNFQRSEKTALMF